MLDIDDMPDYPIEKHFEEGNKIIKEQITQNKNVLVVCTAGISRSAAIVMAYLIKEHRMPYSKAYNTVKRARVFINPNVGFERALKSYATAQGCELCDLEKKTKWFEQYAKRRFKNNK